VGEKAAGELTFFFKFFVLFTSRLCCCGGRGREGRREGRRGGRTYKNTTTHYFLNSHHNYNQVAVAVEALRRDGIPFLSVLVDPTYGMSPPSLPPFLL